jgi:hypothetical protein
VPIYDIQGLVGYADFGWLPLKVLGEFDGRIKYGATGWTRPRPCGRRRSARIGCAPSASRVRWTWADLIVPGRVPAMIQAAMARALARESLGA